MGNAQMAVGICLLNKTKARRDSRPSLFPIQLPAYWKGSLTLEITTEAEQIVFFYQP